MFLKTHDISGMAICDLDGLKAISDQLGHRYGDDYIAKGALLINEKRTKKINGVIINERISIKQNLIEMRFYPYSR